MGYRVPCENAGNGTKPAREARREDGILSERPQRCAVRTPVHGLSDRCSPPIAPLAFRHIGFAQFRFQPLQLRKRRRAWPPIEPVTLAQLAADTDRFIAGHSLHRAFDRRRQR
ncbi:MAG: hypothetical protein DMF88_26180 [Acidobacteria bacterium]|nr:MAG: hypothetical protein DMF88_26180 [Acidobacteriota bacterium]